MLFETRGLVHACTNVTFLTTTILIATPPKIYCRPLQKKSGLRPGIINLSRIIHPYNHNRMIQLSLKSNPYPFRRPPRSAVGVGLLVDSTVAGHFCGFLANALRENACWAAMAVNPLLEKLEKVLL